MHPEANVQLAIEELIALEEGLEERADAASKPSAANPEVDAVVQRLRTTAHEQREALQRQRDRLAKSGGDGGRLELARTLRPLYSMLNEAALGYAVLHAAAHRAFDSQTEGNTATLAEKHLRAYAAAIQELDALISDVVVLETSRAGAECRCQCPACGLGLCLCAPHGTDTVRQAWRETLQPPREGGLRVREPRSGSEAQRVGLRHGDHVVAIDDKEIATDLDLAAIQGAIRAHSSGEEIHIKVQRDGQEALDAIVRRP
ncbi:MAG: PDZ domain-containing protein [Candidatus Limnocylindria bacterium]